MGMIPPRRCGPDDMAAGRYSTAPVNASLSIAFAIGHGNRLIMDVEIDPNADDIIYASTAEAIDAGSGPVTMTFEESNVWEHARMRESVNYDASGNPHYVLADPPAPVPALIFDPRPDVARSAGAPDISYLNSSVRSVGLFQANNIFVMARNMADPRPLESHHDFEEVQHMAFNVCNTIQNSSGGRRGPDLLAHSQTEPLQCAAGVLWRQPLMNLLIDLQTNCALERCTS